jgi:SAM-dependent methyltransferase
VNRLQRAPQAAARSRASGPSLARWPFSLPESLTPQQVAAVQGRVEELSARAQYGWGHTINFGPFTKQGVLGDNYLTIAGHLDHWGWWPQSLHGLRVADIGCYSGALSLLMAHRGAREVVAVDEVPAHVDQCAYVCEAFGVGGVRTLTASLYDLPGLLEPASFDLVMLAGVIYHLSDMLVGLLILRELLRVGGVLLIESNAVADDEHSFANFGRFAQGMWWQPSTLCLRDMCELMGLGEIEVRMYQRGRCLGRARKTGDAPIAFRRGLNYHFEDLRDAVPRATELGPMAPKAP